MPDLRKVDLRRRELARQVRQMSLSELLGRFRQEGVERAFIVFENGHLTLSHPKLLEPLRAFIELSYDFARHEAIFIGTEPEAPTLFFAFVHDTRRGLSQGGLRYRTYQDVASILEDGLRLSQGMTRKNALAGLGWGGGKGILPMTPEMETPDYLTEGAPKRLEVFKAYARFVASLNGVYYTAEDVGTKTTDMDAMLSQNRFQTCVSSLVGGSGNPSPATARGVFWAMQAAWRFLTGSERLQGVKVGGSGSRQCRGISHSPAGRRWGGSLGQRHLRRAPVESAAEPPGSPYRRPGRDPLPAGGYPRPLRHRRSDQRLHHPHLEGPPGVRRRQQYSRRAGGCGAPHGPGHRLRAGLCL